MRQPKPPKERKVKIKPSGCYCDDLHFSKCGICEDLEDENEKQQICSNWNWNYTPTECANEAKELGWSKRTLEEAMKKFGFSNELISSVAYEAENIFDI